MLAYLLSILTFLVGIDFGTSTLSEYPPSNNNPILSLSKCPPSNNNPIISLSPSKSNPILYDFRPIIYDFNYTLAEHYPTSFNFELRFRSSELDRAHFEEKKWKVLKKKMVFDKPPSHGVYDHGLLSHKILDYYQLIIRELEDSNSKIDWQLVHEIRKIEDSHPQIKAKFSNLDFISKINCMSKLENTNLLLKYKIEFLKSKSTTFDFIRKLDCFCEAYIVTNSQMQSILSDLNYSDSSCIPEVD